MNEIRRKFLDVCAVVPRKTDLRECKLCLNTETFVRVRSYPIPFVNQNAVHIMHH